MKLYRRKNSPFWYVDFYHDDKRVQLSTGEIDKRIAEKEAARLINDYKPRTRVKTDLDRIKERYLRYSQQNNRKSTYEREVSILNHFCEWARDKETTEPLVIEDYKEYRLALVKERTVNREYDAIRSMFNKAVIWKMIEENPCIGISKYKIKKMRSAPNFLTVAQVDLVLHKSSSTYLHDMILLDVYTGLRKMELVYLEWTDINFQSWLLVIQAKDHLRWQPKSGEMRTVPIPEPCHGMLLERRAQYQRLSKFAFSNELGRPRLNNLGRDLRELLVRIGLYKRGMGWHTFRHTYASHLVMQGIPLNTVGELLGHQDPSTTKIYAHLEPEHLQAAVEKLDFGTIKIEKIGRNHM